MAFEKKTEFVQVKVSLSDLCGEAYTDAVCEARSLLTGEDVDALKAVAEEPVDFYPTAFQDRLLELLPSVGTCMGNGSSEGFAKGAGTSSFNAATKTSMAPLSAMGWYRFSESGKLHLTSKSEHYHTSMGHAFPGYGLLERARRLGIPNATHNNTRGNITRLLEERLVCAVNEIDHGDHAAMNAILESNDPDVMNRVLNLETGSLAVEAALKMILARFYRMQSEMNAPVYQGRTPVILVMGDDTGGLGANYHGTTVLTQILRGMWPELRAKFEDADVFRVKAIRPNNYDDLEAAFRECETGNLKIAGFFHEIVMMNYGGVLLEPEFLQRAYALCREHDVPTVADEIQSCAWVPGLFLHREYGLRPTFVSLGKGFPGGEYPASRLLFSSTMDNDMPLFGALVTNGQEELASLAYMVTMEWIIANGEVTRQVGEAYEARVRYLAEQHSNLISEVQGSGHMTTIALRDLTTAKRIVATLNERGLDISIQAYKADCPPVLLTKLPLIAGHEVVAFLVECLDEAFIAESSSEAIRLC